MSRIPSAFSGPEDFNGKVPMVFQVLGPDHEKRLLPEELYLHVNPSSLDYSHTKIKEVLQTKAGFVEQHFGDELSEISAEQSTGAFINVEEGVTTAKRRQTIAHRKMKQLFSLFQNNGDVYDDRGNIVLRGRIRMVFSKGTYDGYFTSFDIDEQADEPFQFSLSWDFKIEREAHSLVL